MQDGLRGTAQYDPGRRRRATRSGRQRGCWVFIPADELARAGVDPNGPPPDYRVWGRSYGSVLVRLYAVAAADEQAYNRVLDDLVG